MLTCPSSRGKHCQFHVRGLRHGTHMLPCPKLLRQVIQQLLLEISYSRHSAASNSKYGQLRRLRYRSRHRSLTTSCHHHCSCHPHCSCHHFCSCHLRCQWEQTGPSSCSKHCQFQQLLNRQPHLLSG